MGSNPTEYIWDLLFESCEEKNMHPDGKWEHIGTVDTNLLLVPRIMAYIFHIKMIVSASSYLVSCILDPIVIKVSRLASSRLSFVNCIASSVRSPSIILVLAQNSHITYVDTYI